MRSMVRLQHLPLRPRTAIGIVVGLRSTKYQATPQFASILHVYRPTSSLLCRNQIRYYSSDQKVKELHEKRAANSNNAPGTPSAEENVIQKDVKPQAVTNSTDSSSASSPESPLPPAPAEIPKKMTLWEKVKHEVQHYWDGTKLLGYEIKVSTKLLAKMVAGYELTRRENRQLRRTTQDLARLVPFSMFVIIPFAELLLPFALKLFPNLLPSTYESGADREKKLKKLRKTRGNVSQFLRQTVAESGMVFPVAASPEQKEQFAQFFAQVRSNVETPSRELLVSVARMFKDDVVLDNLSRPQLVAMAKYVNIHPYGTNVMLRYSIRHRMRQIKRDDRQIDYEGIESLSNQELQGACAARGIPTHNVPPGRLREDLGTWLELRLHQKVPSTLLVLASAYTYGEKKIESYYDGLLAVLSALPEELYHEAELEVSAKEATNKQRLEVLKEQQELIHEENKEELQSGHVISVRDEQNIEDDHEHHEMKKIPEAMVKKLESDEPTKEENNTTDQQDNNTKSKNNDAAKQSKDKQ